MPRMRIAVIALAIFLLATLLTFPLGRFVIHSRDLFLVAAVIAISRIAGATAGLVASFAAALLFDWFFDRTPQVRWETSAIRGTHNVDSSSQKPPTSSSIGLLQGLSRFSLGQRYVGP
jgi:uncharacterized membrane protein